MVLPDLRALLACLFTAGALTQPAGAEGLGGATVLVTNTFQGARSEGVEVDVAAFGLDSNLFATVGEGVEFPAFLTLYDVDLTADRIAFRWVDSAFSRQLAGPTPEGNNDRNYFTFDLPAGVAISEVTFDPDASDLLGRSSAPVAPVISGNRVVVNFAGGVVRGLGFDPVFRVAFEAGG